MCRWEPQHLPSPPMRLSPAALPVRRAPTPHEEKAGDRFSQNSPHPVRAGQKHPLYLNTASVQQRSNCKIRYIDSLDVWGKMHARNLGWLPTDCTAELRPTIYVHLYASTQKETPSTYWLYFVNMHFCFCKNKMVHTCIIFIFSFFFVTMDGKGQGYAAGGPKVP